MTNYDFFFKYSLYQIKKCININIKIKREEKKNKQNPKSIFQQKFLIGYPTYNTHKKDTQQV